ncbi:MAG: hypothetical protein IKP40_03785 [Clostridia bacterium]|nr:hypothetical protein [Clostridia bacterium]
MQIDLTCPCEAVTYSLPTASAPWCNLTLRNVGEKRITSVEVTLRLLDALEQEAARQIDREFSLSADPGDCFVMRVSLSGAALPSGVSRIEPVIEKVWHEDGTVWRKAEGCLTEVNVYPLSPGPALDELRFAAGRDAVTYPGRTDSLWVCVCGRPNPAERAHCARCGRARDEVLTAYTLEGVRQTVSVRQDDLQQKARATRQRASMTLRYLRDEPLRRCQSPATRALSAALALTALSASLLGPVAGAPALSYLSADSAYMSGAYAEAETRFEALGAYRDAEGRAIESRYQRARKLLDGNAASLAEAESLFDSLGDYLDSAAWRCEAVYRQAGLMAVRQPEEAREMFLSLGGYRDSAEQANACAYQAAENLLAGGDLEAAWSAFDGLGEWKDSAERASAIRLTQGRRALDAGDTDAAIDYLSGSAAPEAAQLLKRAWYLKGHALYAAGDMAAAGQAFVSASGYLDADSQAKRCILAEARQAMDAGDNVTAMELLASIPGTEDADSLRREAILREASNALDAAQYDRATELLGYLPEDDSAAIRLRNETRYRPAAAALSDEDWLAAIEGFEAISGYSDADDQLKKAQFGHAGALVEAGDLTAAAAIYEELGAYADSPARLNAVRYQLGAAAQAEEDWEEAIRLFTLVGDYEDAAARLRESRQGAAKALLDAGDVSAARLSYQALEDAEGLLACDYADAEALADAGAAEQAASAFAALGDYSDAAARAKALWLQLAELSRKTGAYADAAAWYRLAGDEENAVAMLTIIEEQLYGEAADAARLALSEGRPADAVEALEQLDMSLLPERFRDLPELYGTACLETARAAWPDDPETAWRCLTRVWLLPGAEELREEAGWTLYGPWTDGERLILLRPDGTGLIDGEAFSWTRQGYILCDETGRALLKIASLSRGRLALRDVRQGDTGLILRRAAFPEALQE